MNYKPQLKRCFRCEVIPSEGVFLLSEKGHFLLRGKTYVRLAPFLNGQHTDEEIVNLLQDQVSAAEVYYALELLKRNGYIVEASSSMPPEQAAFWDMLDVEVATVAKRLTEIGLSVAAFGSGIDISPFETVLTSLGFRVVDNGELSIVLTDDYLQNGLESFNQDALIDNRPWMLVRPVGIELWIGPIFIPGKTGCWECLAQRLRGNRKTENYLKKKGIPGPFPTALAALPSTQQTAFGMATTEIAKWVICGHNRHLEGKIVTLNLLSLEKRDHHLVKRPQCSCCGNADSFTSGQDTPIVLQSCRKSFTTDGGHRSTSPNETFEKLAHHISPITGVVSALNRISSREDQHELTISYVADHNFAWIDDDQYFLRKGPRSRSGGKGRHEVQAKTSALCESIERYSGVFQGDERPIHARFKDLEDAFAPNDCMLFSEQQFKNRESWNRNHSRFNWIPKPFDKDTAIEWSRAWSLTYNESRYVPTAYCYYGYPRQRGAEFARADSNGCAAGNSKEEAILQGFMELVERDSIAIWWYNRLKKPIVNLSSFDEPYFQQLQAHYRTRNRDLWVLDITSDLDIPTFAAISRQNNEGAEYIIFGFGTHFDPQIAILRALTELNQLLPAVCSGTSDHYSDNKEALEWWNTATIENQPYLSPDETLEPKEFADYPHLWSDDLYMDVMSCVEIGQAKGLETLVLDQTRPDMGLHVVKVIVPGLRHFWARFGHGRLYDVPVQMGVWAEPLNEEHLNPQLIFL